LTAPEAGRGIGYGERAAEITTTFVGLPRDTFRILHVSTGNVCRSPITERLTRHFVHQRLGVLGGGLVVESAGTWGHEGAPMEAHAETVLAEYGADDQAVLQGRQGGRVDGVHQAGELLEREGAQARRVAHGDDLGTAAVTTQGMGTGEMTLVAGMLASVLRGGTDPARARGDVRELVAAFPPYPR
jgi:hypothetical protein